MYFVRAAAVRAAKVSACFALNANSAHEIALKTNNPRGPTSIIIVEASVGPVIPPSENNTCYVPA